jgi:phosphatidylserine/phosphatidylglycerophosphate/cardiolipin synthase-like enzyme
MFMPGNDIYGAVMAKRKSCFVRGVANTFPRKPKPAGEDAADAMEDLDESRLEVKIADHQKTREFTLDAVQPQGIEHAIGSWVAEVTRNQFRAIGHAIVHSKVLVIDADGPDPYVVTGSHNFSSTASKSNDENFVVIRGNHALAQAYAVSCLSLYDHYRWRETVKRSLEAGRKPWTYADGTSDPDWLEGYMKSKADVLRFFGL